MIKKSIRELSLDSFSTYGTFANMLNPQTVKLGESPIEFFRDMARLR